MRLGVISDTHGTLPAAALEAFAGVDHIVHAGDIGAQWILDELSLIAPVTAVRGNMDMAPAWGRLPDREIVEIGGYRVLAGHVLGMLKLGGVPFGVRVIVCGHTHVAQIQQQGALLIVNPGSAGGPGRDGRAPSVAVVDFSGEQPTARIVELPGA